MRKFTKEISALLASVAVSTAALTGAVAASSETEQPNEAGSAAKTTTVTTTTTGVTCIGTEMRTTPPTEEMYKIGTEITQPVIFTEPTYPMGTWVAEPTTEAMPEETYPIGTWISEPTTTEATTEETYPIGTWIAEPTTTEATTEETYPIGTWIAEPTTTTKEMPPLAGVPMPPDDLIEPTTLPPLLGDIAPVDGDLDADGLFGVTDIVVFQKWLLAVPDTKIYDWSAADLYPDGTLDVFDLFLMKQKLLGEARN